MSKLTNPILSGHWRVSRYVLIVEHRTCECGSCSTAPSIFPRIELTNKHGDTQTLPMADVEGMYQELAKQMRREYVFPILPRSIQTVDVSIMACEECFTELTADQSDFWPTKLPLSTFEVSRLIREAEVMQNLTDEQFQAHLDAKKAKAQTQTKAKAPVKPMDLSQF